MKAVLSPRELAQVIGVSESSLKRWADAGLLDVSRTAGGHRRIPLPEAVRFIRETRATVVRPDVLGLPDLDGSIDFAEEVRDPGERLHQFLVDGQARAARAMILTLYLGGRTVAEICDEPIRFALGRIGELLHDRHEAIYLEHRATDVCVLTSRNEGTPVAVIEALGQKLIGGRVIDLGVDPVEHAIEPVAPVA